MIIERKYNVWVLFATIVLLIPFFTLVFYTHPIADDLSYGFLAKTKGLFEQQVSTYSTWNGRYSGNFFIQLFPISLDNLLFYRIILISSFFLFILSFYFFIRSILIKTEALTLWSITLLTVLTYLSIVPNVAEGFYWYTSVIYYQLSLVLVLCFLALTINYFQQRYFINKSFHLIIALFTLVVTIGVNETVAIVTPFVCLSFFVFSLLSKKEYSITLGVLAFVAIVCSCFVVFSPGNEYRLASYSGNKDIVTSLFMSILQGGRFFAKFIFSLSGLFYVLFVACFFTKLSPLIKQLKAGYLLLGFIVILFLCIFPAYYSTGILGQHRTLNVAALFFVLLLMLTGLKIGVELKDRLPRKPEKMVVYFVLFFFIFGNGRTAMLDLYLGKAQEYNNQLSKRSQIVKNTRSSKLTKLSVQPKSLFVLDVSEDSTHWVNQAYLLDLK